MTIGIGEIFRIALINNFFGITGGANGIFGVHRPALFELRIHKTHHFFYYIWFLVAVTVFLFHCLEQSHFGLALNYLKEDEVAAEGSGINTAHYKLTVFVMGAACAGMAGNINASKMMIISSESFKNHRSCVLDHSSQS